ncbi:SDR family NAD(P)-dependent oxidoreductase [Lacticigenium naphthae]|uniref:SDR family NAD(P)-dependent oxidoreductase n=1 Tax=Lacticigenium naphthae TaxID=515351 RepID=UPI0004141BB4|nr:SDR family oxidoreductase [Lacticigenium naphthae]
MGSLQNKVAIVTGAAQGLGTKIVELFINEGATVVGIDIQEDKIKQAMEQFGDNARGKVLDISNDGAWQELINETVEEFGKLDILVNNASIMSRKGILELSGEEYMNVHSVNSLGTFLGIKYAIPKMQENGSGSIVNISSIGALASGAADGGDAAYGASKGSVTALTRHVAHYFAKDNIRANSVHPGGIQTDMLQEVFDANPELWEKNKENSPLPNHISDAEDIANGVVFLASDKARTITGEQLVIDNGYMTH